MALAIESTSSCTDWMSGGATAHGDQRRNLRAANRSKRTVRTFRSQSGRFQVGYAASNAPHPGRALMGADGR
jgi:hypothetical protein